MPGTATRRRERGERERAVSHRGSQDQFLLDRSPSATACWIEESPGHSRSGLSPVSLTALSPTRTYRPARPYALPGQVSQSPSDISDPSFSSPSRDGEELLRQPRLISTVTFLYGRAPARYPIRQDLLRSYGGAEKAPIRGGGFDGWREPSGPIE